MEKISKNQYNMIANLYKNGMKVNDIASQYNVHPNTIKVILSKCGLTKKDRKGLLDLLDIQKIESLYKDGWSTKNIANQLNVSAESIRRVLKRNGIERRHSLYSVNDHYFDIIDTQDKAYFIGLLWADGCNDVDKNLITITLQERDKHILDSFNDIIENTRPLYFVNKSAKNPNWSDCYALTIISEHMSNVLESYGMVRAKSLVLEFPHWLDKSLLPHFFRGYMDGDGHIRHSGTGYGAEFVGTDWFCENAQRILQKELGISSHLSKPNPLKNTTLLKISTKKDSKIFLDYIYNDANLFLKRKFDSYRLKYYGDDNINNTLTA